MVTSVVGLTAFVTASALGLGEASPPNWVAGILLGLGGAAGALVGVRIQPHVPVRALKLLLSSSMRLGFEGRLAAARTTLRENQSAHASLSWSDSRQGPDTTEEAYAWMHRTANYWREWLNQGTFPDHRWRSYLERSAMALKGMSVDAAWEKPIMPMVVGRRKRSQRAVSAP